jgi:hypothetical protein
VLGCTAHRLGLSQPGLSMGCARAVLGASMTGHGLFIDWACAGLCVF